MKKGLEINVRGILAVKVVEFNHFTARHSEGYQEGRVERRLSLKVSDPSVEDLLYMIDE